MTQTSLSTPQAQATTTPTRRQQVVARLLGAQSFTTINWRHLMQDGVLVQLHVGRCRFSTRLTLEDMGIQVEDEAVAAKIAEWVVLGEKRLLPQAYMKALGRVESGARYALKEHAFRTELGAFVPVTAYLTWREKTEALQTEYLALRDAILANHRELVRQVVGEYEVIAADIYQRLAATHPELVASQSQAHFVTTYCNRIAEQIPSAQRIRESFTFRFVRADSLAPFEPGRATTPTTDLPQEEVVGLTDARLASGQRARQRAILEQDLRRDAQTRVSAMLDDFLTSIVGQLRSLTYEATCDVLATMQRRGSTFSPRSTVQLTNLLAQIRTLNFFGDTEMDQMMNHVQRIVDLAPDARQRSLGDIGRTLRAIATTTRATLLDLDEDPRVVHAGLGLPAYPTPELVRQARAELALPVDVPELPTTTRGSRAEARGDEGSLWAVPTAGRTPVRTL